MKSRKFQKLSLHHIDTSVILEPENTENGRYCTRYLRLVGYKYGGKFSIPMLGELLLYIIQKLDELSKRYDTLDAILKIVFGREIGISSVRGVEEIFLKTKEVLSSLEPMDRLLLSCAIRDCATFVTIDTRLLRIGSHIKRNFGIEVKHPSELV